MPMIGHENTTDLGVTYTDLRVSLTRQRAEMT
jgi:hypothetical protein